MKKVGMELKTHNEAIQGPRGLSIKKIQYKETLENGDNVYQVIIEDDSIIGEIISKKGDKGNTGEKGDTGNGIKIVEVFGEEEGTKRYRMTFTNGEEFIWSVDNGKSAFDIAVDNGFDGTEAEWLESLIGKGLEFNWNGTQLGIRIEGQEEYQYVDLKGQKGDIGKSLEFNWNGTQLGIRVEGQTDYQYKDLQGSAGKNGVGISSIVYKGKDSAGGNVYTINLTNGTTAEFTAPKGDKGEGAEVDLSNYYTKSQTDSKIDEKLKNFCPIPLGGVLPMWNETNPTTLYLGTTWELITAGKYIQSGTTALQTGGSNSIIIAKANLPAVSLKVNSFSLPNPPHTHNLHIASNHDTEANSSNLAFHTDNKVHTEEDMETSKNYAKSGGGQNTGTASPSTENLGSGTAITIQPSYITLKFWKRLT